MSGIWKLYLFDWKLFSLDSIVVWDEPLLVYLLHDFQLLFYLTILPTLPTAILGNDSPSGMHELPCSTIKMHYGWIHPDSLERSKFFGNSKMCFFFVLADRMSFWHFKVQVISIHKGNVNLSVFQSQDIFHLLLPQQSLPSQCFLSPLRIKGSFTVPAGITEEFSSDQLLADLVILQIGTEEW